ATWSSRVFPCQSPDRHRSAVGGDPSIQIQAGAHAGDRASIVYTRSGRNPDGWLMSTQWWRRLWQAVGTEFTAPHQAGHTKRATADDVLLKFTIGEPSREDGPVTPLGSSGRGWVLWLLLPPASSSNRRTWGRPGWRCPSRRTRSC